MTIGLTIGLAFVAPISGLLQTVAKKEEPYTMGNVRGLFGLQESEIEEMVRKGQTLEIRNLILLTYYKISDPTRISAVQLRDWAFEGTAYANIKDPVNYKQLFQFPDLERALEEKDLTARVDSVKKIFNREIYQFNKNNRQTYDYLA
jgi:hypothetical protein